MPTTNGGRKAGEKTLRSLKCQDILWILDVSNVERQVWYAFWAGKFPGQTESTIKWCLGMSANERDAQLAAWCGEFRTYDTGRASNLPSTRTTLTIGHWRGVPSDPEEKRHFQESRFSHESVNDTWIALCRARKAWLTAQRNSYAALTRNQRQKLHRRMAQSAPEKAPIPTGFQLRCLALCKAIATEIEQINHLKRRYAELTR